MSRYTIGDNSNLKYNITKSMVGPFPLAPHHDYLQHMYHVYLMQMVSKMGCYNKECILQYNNPSVELIGESICHRKFS